MIAGEIAVVERLQRLSSQGETRANERLRELQPLLGDDLRAVERNLLDVPGARDVHRGARHLLACGGKRLRPVCVLLAARLGRGVTPEAIELAIAAELVHNATLLHDDVVDDASSRRGVTAARLVYGNAISIFAGDWLLVDALRRVRRAAPPDVLERLLEVIDEMIVAESLQLERRGRLATSFDDWLAVATGKTAALFRWAMYAGARVGGLDRAQAALLERFGCELGLAYQAVDDVLDVAGDAGITGKALFTDLREGKGSLPVVLAVRSDPGIAASLVLEADASADRLAAAAARLASVGAVDEARAYAVARTAAAIDTLTPFAAGEARDTLAGIAYELSARLA